jgi:hypothetical protein
MSDEEIQEQWEKDDQDSIIEFRVNYCKSLYIDTKNPLYVWQAIKFLRDNCKEYPDWVKNYLSNVAENIVNIRKPGKEAPAMIKRAIGLDNAKKFADFHYSWQKDEAYDRVIQERGKRAHGNKVYIYHDVGLEFKVSEDTIKKWYLEVKKWRDSIVAET